MDKSMDRGLIFVLLAALGTVSFGQTTQVDLRTQSKSVDFSGAATTKPFRSGTALPSTCSAGEVFWLTSAAPGANVYGCTATNTWTVEGGSVVLGGDVVGVGAATEVRGIQGRPVSSAMPNAGQALVWNSTNGDWEPQTVASGSGSGAQFESGLGDFAVTRISNTQISIAANPNGTAVRCGNSVTVFTGTVAITAGTGSLNSGAALFPYIYCSSNPAAVKVDTNSAVNPGHLTLTGASFGNANVSGYPADSIPLPKITGGTATDQFDSNPFTDFRSFLSSVVVRCGANLVRTVGGDGSYTCAVDPTSALAWTGSADLSGATTTKPSRFAASDPATCSEGESYYSTTSHQRKDCIAANSWRQSPGLLTFQSAAQPVAIAGSGQSTTIYSYSLPSGAIQPGGCITVDMAWQSTVTGSGGVTPAFSFGSASVNLYSSNNYGDAMSASVEVCNLAGSSTAQQINERALGLSAHTATGVPAYTVSNQNTQQALTIALTIDGSSSSGFSVAGLWFRVTRN